MYIILHMQMQLLIHRAPLLIGFIKNWQSRKSGTRRLLPPQLLKPCRIWGCI